MLSEVQIAKYEITVPVCMLEGADTSVGNLGLLSSLAEVLGFLKYELHIIGIVLHF